MTTDNYPLTMGVLVTNYNSWSLALACIDANIALCGAKLTQVVLVDDCSTDPTPAVGDKQITFIQNKTNQGFARSLNIGLTTLNTDLIALFDADARPLHEYVDEAAKAFTENPSLALLGFTTVDENGKPTTSYDTEPGAASLILGQAVHSRFKRWLERHEDNICITTCAMIIRKAALADLVGFDEQLDWLDVDLDFSMKVSRSSWKLQVSPALVAFHKGGGTPMLTAERVLKFYKNRWLLLRKYGKVKYPQLAKWVIVTRLRLEYLLMATAGKALVKNKATREDKLFGRHKIIQYCQKNY